MATKAISSVTRQHGKLVVLWEELATGDQGAVFEPPPGYALDSMQFTGTFGGGTAKIEGSNEPGGAGTYSEVEATGVAADGLVFPTGQALFFRPALAGGTGGDVDARALFAER